jgi:hypothetical protein
MDVSLPDAGLPEDLSINLRSFAQWLRQRPG